MTKKRANPAPASQRTGKAKRQKHDEASKSGVLRIAAFNVQAFGKTKAAKEDVMETLVKVVKRYDIILIQEIRDYKGTALTKLMDAVNEASRPIVYKHETSEPLGDRHPKEQYSFIYRTESASVVETYQYNDGPENPFQREPFCIKFRLNKTGLALSEIVLMAVHTDPGPPVSVTIRELNALVDVHKDVQKRWKTDNILIMGDLNAEGKSVSKKTLKGLALRQDPPFSWLIDDYEDTTVTKPDAAYDRFIATGKQLIDAVVPKDGKDARVFRFDTEFGLSEAEALAVSDHYPIEVELR